MNYKKRGERGGKEGKKRKKEKRKRGGGALNNYLQIID
jgi:hypothetical protein